MYISYLNLVLVISWRRTKYSAIAELTVLRILIVIFDMHNKELVLVQLQIRIIHRPRRLPGSIPLFPRSNHPPSNTLCIFLYTIQEGQL